VLVKKIYQHISLTLKALRREHGWSLDKAAAETGVSKAMLGQIERGESSPTISTLWKIASGFGASFSSFIEDIESDFKEPIYRSGKTQTLHPQDKKIRVMPIFPFDNEFLFEVFIIELLPGCEHLSPPHQPGVVEHIIVVEGAMEVLVNNVWRLLKKGEGLRFNANQAHGYRNITPILVCFHNIIHYSNRN
jgi:transcriptional regulator with XRE-family HTH domain